MSVGSNNARRVLARDAFLRKFAAAGSSPQQVFHASGMPATLVLTVLVVILATLCYHRLYAIVTK